MEISVELLLGLVSNLSSFATLHSWINEQNKTNGTKKDIKKLNGIDVEIKCRILEELNDEEDIEKIDDFISKHALEFKEKGLSILFSEEEKEETIRYICKSNLTCDRNKVRIIVSEYFELLSEYINMNLSFETKFQTKFLSECIKEEGNNIVESITDLVTDKKCFNDKKYSRQIIAKCNALNSIFMKSVFQKELLSRAFAEDYITADNLEVIILKIRNLLDAFDTEFLNDSSKHNSKEPLEALLYFTKMQAPDLAIDLGEYYHNKTRHIIKCIEGYSNNRKDFFIAIGALGLIDNNSDEDIFKCIMKEVCEFLSKIIDVLNEQWKDSDYKKIEGKVIDEMNKEIYYKIKWYFTKESKEILREIYERKNISDIELANIFKLPIVELRRNLYECTKEFLGYGYLDNKSTELYIYSDYRKAIQKYYRELFEEE